MIEKLSDGNPTVLAIGPYRKSQKKFDDILTTKLLDYLKKLVGVYVVHPFETDYSDMPEVDFTASLCPPARARMLGEDPSYRQKYDMGTSFQDLNKKRTGVARIILQEFPWPRHKDAIEFAFGPAWGVGIMPACWGSGWFKHDGVYYLYPFADKCESHPNGKEDFVLMDAPERRGECKKWDFSTPLIAVLDELEINYFQTSDEEGRRMPHADYVNCMNRAKLYVHVKAESYGQTLAEAVASEALVMGSNSTLRHPYPHEFGFWVLPNTKVETLKRFIRAALDNYDKQKVREHLHAAREKLWDYGRLAREIADILRGLKK